jgi:hypothetical protein
VREVLDQIRRRAPDDYARIIPRVREIAPLPRGDAERGTLGQWVPDPGESSFENPDWEDTGPGVVLLSDKLAAERYSKTLGVVAHEFGHVATRYFIDLDRGECPDDEWASELTADWYAYKWGFGRMIGQYRKGRNIAHHCVGPGQTIIDGYALNGVAVTHHFRVTRGFRVRLLKVTRRRVKPKGGK